MLRLSEAHGFPFDTVQMPLNVMDAHFSSFESKVLPLLIEQGIGVIGMKSLAAGKILASGAVSAEECLRYALSLPTSVVVSGMDSLEVLRRNVQIVRSFRPLGDEHRPKPALARGRADLISVASQHQYSRDHRADQQS